MAADTSSANAILSCVIAVTFSIVQPTSLAPATIRSVDSMFSSTALDTDSMEATTVETRCVISAMAADMPFIGGLHLDQKVGAEYLTHYGAAFLLIGQCN